MIDPNLVRDIDRIIGSKICWLLTQLAKFTRRRRDYPKKIRRVLFIKVSEMGSTVLSFPAINLIKKDYPGVQLYFLTFKGNEEMISVLEAIPKKNILAIDTTTIPRLIVSSLVLAKKLRSLKIDAIIDFELFSRISVILGFLVNAPIQVGFYKFYMEGLYRGEFFTHKVIYNHYLHTTLAFLTLAKSLKEPAHKIPLLKEKLTGNLQLPRYQPLPKVISAVRKKLHQSNNQINESTKLVIFNTHASDFIPERKWPKPYFVKLTKEVLKTPNTAVILIGTVSELDYIGDIASKVNHPRCINFAGQTTLVELLTLFSIAHLMVTNDSGPAHFGALTPIYIISLFGPETPLLYAPLTTRNVSLSAGLACSPCINTYNARRSPCQDDLCMSELKVDNVLPYLTKMMSMPPPKASDNTTYNIRELLSHIHSYNRITI